MFLHLRSESLASNLSEHEDGLGHCGDMSLGIIIWASLSTLFSLVGCPACVAVLLELFRRHKVGTSITPNDVFMLNLTVMDLVFLFFIPFGLCNYIFWDIISFGKITNFMYSLNLAGRPLLTACICLDCYLAVVHPVTYRANKSLAPRVLMAAAVWTLTAAQGSASVVFVELNHSAWAMLVYIIALPVILICDAAILWTLKKSYRGGGDLHPKKKKALQVITNSMVMTVISYVPPVLVYVFGSLIFPDEKEYDCFLAMPILILPTAGSTIMPLLYLGNLGRLKSPCCLE
ncbi:proteinase-activated receptor 3-like [Stegastes partitus]|uniref:Proteinase-activated receptor 3-like n=1 Tax=Stegastes partitus TaxID=144197 RepID=A0A9Y4K3D6_9TELE|nr:PREDICTED: proteinase-activated receptor 3-like [Stegastes partitus]